MLTLKEQCKTVVIGTDIFVLGSSFDHKVSNYYLRSYFKMYSAKSKHWKKLNNIFDQ